MSVSVNRSMQHGALYRKALWAAARLGKRFTHSLGNIYAPVATPQYQVIFVRHGQSTWNKANRFIGWTDTPLTPQGLEEARAAGRILANQGVEFDEVHVSMLKRSIKTAWAILEEMGQEHVPIKCHWRLNERSYGALVGMNKKECVGVYGAEQVKVWRRSYDNPPPPMTPSHKYYPGNDKHKYGELDPMSIPLSESLHDTKLRAVKYWEEVIAPAIRSGKRVMVCGHENNLRSLFMYLDNIPKDEIMDLEVPRAVPIVYDLDASLRPVKHPQAAAHISGRYMGYDEEVVAAIQERDQHQVYDLSIRVNLEDLNLNDAVSLISQNEASVSAKNNMAPQSPGRRGLLRPVEAISNTLIPLKQQETVGEKARERAAYDASPSIIGLTEVLAGLTHGAEAKQVETAAGK